MTYEIIGADSRLIGAFAEESLADKIASALNAEGTACYVREVKEEAA